MCKDLQSKLRWTFVFLALAIAIGLLVCNIFIDKQGPQGIQGSQGVQGEQGVPGKDGENGKSAYELAVLNGYSGSPEEWLASLVGEAGAAGQNGKEGPEGKDGKDGTNGKSAYELACENGFNGSLSEWLASLVGKNGVKGINGTNGVNGKSAYELACENGFNGSLSEWLVSLVGKNGVEGINGTNGVNGKSAYELAVENGYEGDLQAWLASLVGVSGINGNDGKSAYELAVEKGYMGTEEEWIDALMNKKGDKGDTGNGIAGIEKTATSGLIDTYTITYTNGDTAFFTVTNGSQGKQGEQGVQGIKGKDGHTPVVTIQKGNWFIDNVDSGVSAKGPQGDKGDKGDKGDSGGNGIPHIGTNGNWWIDDQDTGIKAEAVGIENVAIDYKGQVIITLTDGSEHSVEISKTACEHTFTSVVTLPTCQEKGYTTYTCSKCGYSYKNLFVPASGHHFADGECVFCHLPEPYNGPETDTSWYDAGENTFVISTGEQLAGLAYLVNSGTTFKNKTVSLGKHIDLASAEWIPIGNPDHPFEGIFNGKDLTISNLKISKQTSYVGLFGYVKGSISNFSVTNANISVGPISDTLKYVAIACANCTTPISGVHVSGYVNAENHSYVGGVVGYSSHTVCSCSSSASITGKDYVGGIAGQTGAGYSVTYSDLHNEGDVSGEDYVGGLIGSLYNVVDSSGYYTMSIQNCSNSGEVNGRNYVAGLFGYLIAQNTYGCGRTTALTANELHNTGNITGNEYVGGIAGYGYSNNSSSKILNATNMSVITAKAYVGVLAGKLEAISLVNCDNKGSGVKATGYVVNGSDYYVYLGGYVGYGYIVEGCNNTIGIVYTDMGKMVGGIAGYTSNVVRNCTNSANISGKSYVGGIAGQTGAGYSVTYSDLHNEGDVSGEDYVGGLIGSLYNVVDSSGHHIMSIQNCSNSGEVNGRNYVAGLFGNLIAQNTYGCGRTTALTANELHNTGNITGNEYVGGIAGYGYSNDSSSKILNATNMSVITAKAYVGALAGKLEAISLVNCDNKGSGVKATGYVVDGSEYYVYFGGYVGYGYIVEGCNNTIGIVYTDVGKMVGGIAGYTSNVVRNCTNSANISGKSYVGGIAGQTGAGYSVTYSDLHNEGDVSGEDYVGGLIGSLYNVVDSSGYYTMSIQNCSNSGEVNGRNYVAGLFGNLIAQNTYGCGRTTALTANELHNTGNITGNEYVGGIAGYGYSNNSSSKINFPTNSAIITGKSKVDGIVGEISQISICDGKNAGTIVVIE